MAVLFFPNQEGNICYYMIMRYRRCCMHHSSLVSGPNGLCFGRHSPEYVPKLFWVFSKHSDAALM